MADNRKITLEIEAKDYASATFRSVSGSVRNFAVNANNNLIKTNNALRTYNNTMRGFNTTVQRALADAGRCIYNFTTDAIKQFAELEKQHARTMGAMSSNYNFNYNGNNTPEQQNNMQGFYSDSERLKQQALTIGTLGPTGRGALYNPLQISSAQTALVKAGISPEDILGTDIVSNITKFAGGNQLSLDTATEFAVQLGTQFKINPEDWGGMLDQVTYSANQSIIDVEDIIASMKYAGNMASGFDAPLSDVLTALVVMGNSGLKGSQAGTGIQSIFTRGMSTTGITTAGLPPTQNVEDIYTDFHDKVVDENGMFMGLGNFTENLAETMSGLTDEELAWFNKKMFGMFQQKTALALGRTDEDGNVVFDEYSDLITSNSSGTNDATYDIAMDSSYGDLTKVQNAWTGFKMNFGDKLSPLTKAISEEIFQALVNGDVDFDFDGIRVTLKSVSDEVGKAYGEDIGGAANDLGNFALDSIQIGEAILPILGFSGSSMLKIMNGDWSGAWDTFMEGLEDVNENIDDLPPELQGAAEGFKNLILMFERLFALNIVTRVAEGFTSIIRLFSGNKIISPKTTVTSASTSVNATSVIVNAASVNGATFGAVTNATIAAVTANTAKMTVYAGVVNVIGGGALAGAGGALAGAGGALAGASGALLGAGGATALLGGAGATALLGGAGAAGASIPLLGGAGAAGTSAIGNAINLYRNPLTGTYMTAGGMAKSVGGTALKALGTVGMVMGIASMLTTDAGINNSPAKMYEEYEKAFNSGSRGDDIGKQMIANNGMLLEGGEMPDGSWMYPQEFADFIEQSSAMMGSSDGIQQIYDAMIAQIDSGGSLSEDFLSNMMSGFGIDNGFGQVFLDQILNTMFKGDYKTPGKYSGGYANDSIDKFVRENRDDTADWSALPLMESILNDFNADLSAATSTITDYASMMSPSDKLSLGLGPVSDSYINGMFNNQNGIDANAMLGGINSKIDALNTPINIDLANPTPIVNVDVDVKVDKNGVVTKNVINDFANVDNWLYNQTRRHGG